MSLKKQYNKANTACKVTFRLAKDVAQSLDSAFLTGEFNNWNTNDTPMKKLKSGEFTVSVNLEKGKEYQFKYLLNGNDWINDKEADSYIINEFQTENSVVIV